MRKKFIPFGSQYYRAPTPLKENWEKDLKLIKESGLNTIKIWIQWRWNCPEENTFYFEDIDNLMDLAHQNGLMVIPNIIFDVAPAWFYRKYPDSLMVTCDGRKVEPVATAWRQTGGAPGPCYNHRQAAIEKDRFLKETIKRYKDHPALYMWDLWNEPELTCGILRQPVQGNMVCYCSNCEAAFKEWLRQKYGSISALNNSWQRNYRKWEEIELPRRGDTFNDMIDWREFFSDILVDELKRRVNITKQIDPKTPVMIHSETIPEFNQVFSCNNDYKMAELCDVYGSSNGNWPFSSAFFTSCARGKKVINAEIYLSWGGSYDRPRKLSFEEVKANVFIPLARGIKGFISWQFRPETLGQEAPAWGLTTTDGRPTELLKFYSKVCIALQQNAELIEDVKPLPSRIAILNSTRAQTLDWCISGSVDIYTNSVIGAFSIMYDCNLNADIVSLEKLDADLLGNYKMVYCPFPYYMDEKAASLLKAWVRDGGFLVSEAFFGTVNAETGLHAPVVPGYGFDEVFGVTEEAAHTSASFGMASDKITLKDRNAVLSGDIGTDGEEGSSIGGPVTASLIDIDALKSEVPVFLDKTVGNMHKSDVITGYCFAEELRVSTADIIGRFANGSPAITLNKYGSGTAVLIGTLPGYAYNKTSSAGVLEFIKSIAETAGIIAPIHLTGGKVRADLLKDNNSNALLVINSFDEKTCDINIVIRENLGAKRRIVNIIDSKEHELEVLEEGYCVRLKVKANSHDAYRIE